MAQVTARDILVWVVTFIIPPLGVFLAKGRIDNSFWISLLLTFFAWLPGVLYSFWVLGAHGTGGRVQPGDPLNGPLLSV